jgi:hypothetical protein
MPTCPQTPTCGLHRSIAMREVLGVWQSFYCDGVFLRCERYKLAAAGSPVPDKLLPNGRLTPGEGDGEGERPSRPPDG